MAETITMKDDHHDHRVVEIKSPKSIELPKHWDDSVQELTISFFNSRSRRKNGSTGIISLFLVIHLLVFAATMIINDCPSHSKNGNCVFRAIGRVSFQPLTDNPLLGPSSSTLEKVGALQWKLLVKHQQWRLATSPWLHGGLIDLVINLSGVMLVGIHLEQEFGPLRIGIIYVFSAFVGSLVSALFVQNNAAVGSSAALFGLLGSMLSGLIRNWKVYSDKFAALMALFLVATISFSLGLLPFVDNFANLGGFLSGFLLGFVLFFDPRLGQVQNKKGLFEYKEKRSVDFKRKLDKPILRSISLVVFALILSGGLVAVLHGVNLNKYCSSCHYINCIPSERWSCNGQASSLCEISLAVNRSILTCKSNKKFRTYTFTNISQARMRDLCSQMCS